MGEGPRITSFLHVHTQEGLRFARGKDERVLQRFYLINIASTKIRQIVSYIPVNHIGDELLGGQCIAYKRDAQQCRERVDSGLPNSAAKKILE